MTDFKLVQLKDIKPDPNQPRKFYDDSAMQELTDSVREKGILQPILIRPNGKGYILVCGERRYKAAVSVQAEKTMKRVERINKRIAELRAKKKELTAKKSPAKKK